MTIDLEHIVNVLAFFDEIDLENELGWSVDANTRDVTFWSNCNDMFFWGCADSESIEPGDLDDIRTAIKDVTTVCPDVMHYTNSTNGIALWCARKRKMRPQGCAYPSDPRIWLLFDACGPERESGLGCSNKRPGT
jgi:hypothetical protein